MEWSSTTLSASFSSPTHQWKYDVFLSFRGEDTRKSFTGHLHRELCQKGIYTFIDDQLRRGEQISPALLKAIEESRFSIIIFSKNYASSSWCLDELTKILDCVEVMGHTAIPVFYNVDPSHVRRQAEGFAEAFAKYEQIYGDKSEKVLRWRNALTVASGLSGYDSRDRHEVDVIDEVVTMIFNKLIDASSSNMEGLVGMGSRILDMAQLLDIGSDDVQMVGIWGMAGIGKTTIAYQVYKKIYAQFDECCFLPNVREDSQRHGLPYLQEKLLSQILKGGNLNRGNFNDGINFIQERLQSRKVLIVLDDVDMHEQLEALAGNHYWFGAGSRIIITTKDKALLNMHGVDSVYKAGGLKYIEALELFCWYAFKHNPPAEDYMQLCKNFVEYIDGLPLAIKVLGSFVKNKTIDEWKSALDKLKRIPHKDIQKVLRISFDGLDDNQKDIFLDIACFFKGQDKDFVGEILESCDFFPANDIRVLEDNCLIIVLNNKLCMHDLLQEMGWEIVRQENVKCPGKRSRLWFHDEVNNVLTTNSGTEAVEGIVLDLTTSKELHFSADAFKGMSRLRLLRFYDKNMDGSMGHLSTKEFIDSTNDSWRWWDYEMQTDCKLHLFGDFKFLSNNLRSLYWHGYPLKSLPSNFHPKKLFELNMCYSRLEQLWKGNKPFEKLKFIKLSHSHYLTKTPDFSGAPNLSSLILKGCTSLAQVHPSIGALKQLVFLNLEGCKNLESFASSIHMNSLRILTLSGCSKLKKFPEILKNMQSLRQLFLDETALRELPSSIGHLNGLVLLNLANCKKLVSLPQSTCKLTSLQILTLAGCSELKKLPDELGSLQCLVELNADGSGIQDLPPSIRHLTNLQVLSLAECKKRVVFFSLWSSPTGCLQLRSLSYLSSLKTLNLRDCNLLEGALPSDLSSLASLNCLDLRENNFKTIPASLRRLSQLTELLLSHCKSLQSVPELPSSIRYVDANHCPSLETFSYTSCACGSLVLDGFYFTFCHCLRLVENEHSDTVGAILQWIQLAASRPKFVPFSQGTPRPFFKWDVIVPGSSIPERFVHQNMGPSVTVQLPPHWYNTNLMGLAVCAVFAVDPTIDRFDLGFTVFGGFDFQFDSIMIDSVKDTDHMWFGYRCVRRRSDSLLWFTVQSRTMKILFHGRGYRHKDGECHFPCGTMWPGEGQKSENPLCQTEHPLHHLSSRSKLLANFFIFPSSIFLRN
ncbi:hypothetical protein PVL29_024718 [Vitis rotundifolia]|uniref:ADP-ribosyl cyclase/cyclic ADP-ribose hydrolase n=1 Tax=Vitis rotundifolia TaxID=103349 RepID=A0AA38YSI9_VITRO|nr:hypothetical protein PVL29_024718 [Vitis rotundifolia]